MRLVIERVKSANLKVDNQLISEIGEGLIVLVGVCKDDDIAITKRVANKIVSMRIFDLDGKMNQSVKDKNGEILLVSNFTLCTKETSGARPDFGFSADKQIAKQIYDKLAEEINALGVVVKKGVFGADMQISAQLDGPITIYKEIK